MQSSQPPESSNAGGTPAFPGKTARDKRHFWIGVARCFAPLCLLVCLGIKEMTIERYRKLSIQQNSALTNFTDVHNRMFIQASNTIMELREQRDELSNEAMAFAVVTAIQGYQAGLEKMPPQDFMEAITNWAGTNVTLMREITNGMDGTDRTNRTDRRRL